MDTFLVEEENTIYEIDLECQKKRDREKKSKEEEQKNQPPNKEYTID
ncbi:MAG: hypothetical protein ACI4F9_03895 [Lachnospiraceae bacterium]